LTATVATFHIDLADADRHVYAVVSETETDVVLFDELIS